MTEHGGPSWQRVAGDISARIVSGEYRVGDPIPSTPKLEQQYGVSKTVVRQAVEQLRREGILAGHPGKAVYVQATPDAAATELRDFKALREQVADLARRVAGDQELREIVSRIEANLIGLYSKTGFTYPGGEAKRDRRARHG